MISHRLYCMNRCLRLSQFNCLRMLNTNCSISEPQPEINWRDIVINPDYYKQLVILRKQINNCEIIDEIVHLWNRKGAVDSNLIVSEILSLATKLPNEVHPIIKDYESDFKLLKTHGEKVEFDFKPSSATEILQGKDILKMLHTNLYTGERSYYFIRDLVKLEQALVDYTLKKLINKGFEVLSVPDILPEDVINRGGMPIGERTQLYQLESDTHGSRWCLSGTAEMAIAAFLRNCNFPVHKLPKYYTAVSRCYRAEISRLASEKGIYRVHQFTKVEMFGVCLPDQSENLLEEFLHIQEELFSPLDFHFRVIDMAPHELGHHAYRKYDIEAWLPGMKRYGEISSCSDCIDYQSRRLNIRSGNQFLHTVNGTACAIPRMVAAITETHQDKNGRILLPAVLQSLMGMDILGARRGPNINRTAKSVKIFKANDKNTNVIH